MNNQDEGGSSKNFEQRSTSSSSLLERIQKAQERERQDRLQQQQPQPQPQQNHSNNSNSVNPQSMTTSIPNYGPISNTTTATTNGDTMNSNVQTTNGSSSIFSGWMNSLAVDVVGVGGDESSLTQGLLDNYHIISDEEYGQRVNQATLQTTTIQQQQQQQQEQQQASSSQSGVGIIRGISPDDYSMSAYFQMFVMDVYSLFLKLHPIGRVVLIILLLWLLWKLL